LAAQAQRSAGSGDARKPEQVVLFQVAGKPFAVDLKHVERIIDYREPTETPRRPPHIEGVVEDRGRFVAVMNLRKRFGVAGPGPAHPAVLLLRGAGPDPIVGLVVDQVMRVFAVPPDGVLSPPPRVFGIRAELIRGVANAGGRAVVWLDVAKLLSTTEVITLLA
jgi:purine-binding chemotaxis protein CheW